MHSRVFEADWEVHVEDHMEVGLLMEAGKSIAGNKNS